MEKFIDWAIVGTSKMSDSQKNLRSKYSDERIKRISMIEAMQEVMCTYENNKNK